MKMIYGRPTKGFRVTHIQTYQAIMSTSTSQYTNSAVKMGFFDKIDNVSGSNIIKKVLH